MLKIPNLQSISRISLISIVLLVTLIVQGCGIGYHPVGEPHYEKGAIVGEERARQVILGESYRIEQVAPVTVKVVKITTIGDKVQTKYETVMVQNGASCSVTNSIIPVFAQIGKNVGLPIFSTVVTLFAACTTPLALIVDHDFIMWELAKKTWEMTSESWKEYPSRMCDRNAVPVVSKSKVDGKYLYGESAQSVNNSESVVTNGNVSAIIMNNQIVALPLSESGTVELQLQRYPELLQVKGDFPILFSYANAKMETTVKQTELKALMSAASPPHLRILSAVALEDALSGGILQAEEEGTIVLNVMNDGKGQAFDVKLTVSGQFPGINYKSTHDVGDMKPGETKSVRIPLTASLDVRDGKFDITFQARDQLGRESLLLKLQPAIITKALDKPELTIASLEWSDVGGHALGNGNSIPENTETLELKVKVQNIGKGPAKDVTLNLKDLPGTEAIISNTNVGNIPVGGVKEGILALKFLKLYKPKGTDIPLSVTVADARPISISASNTFTVPYQYNEPLLRITDVELFDGDPNTNSRGNMNHLIDQDEEVEMRVHVENTGTMSAEGVTVSLSTNKPNIRVSPSEMNFGSLPSGGKKRYATFSVEVPASVEPGPVQFAINVKQKDFAPVVASQKYTVMEASMVGTAMIKGGTASARTTLNLPLPENIDEVPYLAEYRNKNAYAVVMGVGNYKKQGIGALPYAKADAVAVRNYLVNIGGIPKENIQLLMDSDATLTEMRLAIKEWLSRRVDKNSQVVVYFSGHGVPETEKKAPYLLPFDGDPNAPKSTSYSVAELKEDINALPTKNVVIALDACYSGSGRSVKPKGVRGALYVEDDNTPTEAVMLSASKSDQTSWDYAEKSHGLFTYYMLKGMRGKEVDTNGDGYVDVDELFAYLKKEVPAMSRRIEPSEQTPVISGSGKGIRLTRNIQ